MTLDLAPHLDETIERSPQRHPWPLRAVERYRPSVQLTPDFLKACGPPFDGRLANAHVQLWRFAGSLVIRADGQLYAPDRDEHIVELPVDPEAAEKHLRWPEAYAQPERAALLLSAWLGLIPLLDQDEVEAVSGPAMRLMAFAPARLAEAWRAPARDGDELIFFAATDPHPAQNQVQRVTADLANRWIELEPVCEGWHDPPGMGEMDDPGVIVNFRPDILNIDPEPPVLANPIRDPEPPAGLFARLRRLLGGR